MQLGCTLVHGQCVLTGIVEGQFLILYAHVVVVELKTAHRLSHRRMLPREFRQQIIIREQRVQRLHLLIREALLIDHISSHMRIYLIWSTTGKVLKILHFSKLS